MAWQKVASLDALRDGAAIGVDIAGTTIALFQLGDEVFAISGICTHEFGLLCHGFIEPDDGTVECPLHQALFDIRTGKAQCAPATQDLDVYPVRIEGADILIDVAGVRPGKAASDTTAISHEAAAISGPGVAGNGAAKSARGAQRRRKPCEGLCLAQRRSLRHSGLGLYR